MSHHRSIVPWPIIELFDAELGLAQPEPETQPEPEPIPAEALFMAGCDVFLTREGADVFMLTLKHRGQVSEIRLRAGLDSRGQPALLAFVG
ncbi:MAG: hypothetical protein WAW96_12280 [Alphaproteobacteria bacterium]